MLILIGKSGSGKDTIAKELQNRGWNKIVTDTTRKPRSYEKDGVDYNFISEKKFNKRLSINYYYETQEYIMADGSHVRYGTPNFICREKDFVIMSPRSFREIRDKVQSFAIYLYANDSTIKERLGKRGDNHEEVKRRMDADREDFSGIENEVDKIVYNNVGYDIKEITDKIEKIVIGKMKAVRMLNMDACESCCARDYGYGSLECHLCALMNPCMGCDDYDTVNDNCTSKGACGDPYKKAMRRIE